MLLRRSFCCLMQYDRLGYHSNSWASCLFCLY